MKRTTAPNSSGGLYVDEIPGVTLGTTLIKEDRDNLQEEIVNAILSQGITLNGADQEQLAKAIAQYSSKGDFYQEAVGSLADAYLLENTNAQKQITEYKDGMRIRFRVTNTNTGASTIDINSIGAKGIKVGISDLIAGMITAGQVVELVFHESDDNFKLVKMSDWAPWIPVVTAGGGMTVSSLVIDHAIYKVVNNILFFDVFVTFTLGGGAASNVIISLPRITLDSIGLCCRITDQSTYEAGVGYVSGASANINIYRYDNANWTTGVNRRITLTGFYAIG